MAEYLGLRAVEPSHGVSGGSLVVLKKPTFNQVVTGSIPVGLTISNNKNKMLLTTGEHGHWKIEAVSAPRPQKEKPQPKPGPVYLEVRPSTRPHAVSGQ
ncbi:MAG: hypothetical protein O7I42_01715 [Alphaproteobacteria bacterium]|nr:hypothetical protein [Alphaproteobacteria bacterium]